MDDDRGAMGEDIFHHFFEASCRLPALHSFVGSARTVTPKDTSKGYTRPTLPRSR